MKIGIIGSGAIGGNLGIHFSKAGHNVLFSSRNPNKLQHLVEEAGESSQTGTVADAVSFGEIILYAPPFNAIEKISDEFKDELAGKIIIDAANPYPERDGELAQKVRDDDSKTASEYTAEYFPKSTIVKAFNTIYSAHLKERAFQSGANRLAIPFATDNEKAKNKTKQLLEDIGFDSVFVGQLSESKIMDVGEKIYAKSLSKQELIDLINS